MINAKLTRPIKSRLAFIAYPNVTCTPGVVARCAACDIFACLMGEVFSGDQHLLECNRQLFFFTGPPADPSGPLVAIYNRRSMDQSSGSNASEGDRASHPTESSHLNPPTPACCLLCLFDIFRDQRLAVYTLTQ